MKIIIKSLNMLLLLIAFTLVMIFTSACNKQAYILFNKYPFSEETMSATTNVFKPGEKIYYLVTTPKTVKTKRLLLQVMKMGKHERLGYETVWGKQVKVRDEQVYYYTDYFVFNEAGAYEMRAYSKDEPTKLLTANYFYIK
ncbi:hypothetical protein J6N69_01740 [bacterium]|nr:hypothetical protein [bacterium]